MQMTVPAGSQRRGPHSLFEVMAARLFAKVIKTFANDLDEDSHGSPDSSSASGC